MNAIQTFNFHSKEVRTATDLNGDVYFCLTDVADVLEISNANPSRFNLDEAGVHKMYISYPSGWKQVTFINEPNLYRVEKYGFVENADYLLHKFMGQTPQV